MKTAKKSTFSLMFYIKKTKLLKNGEAPICLRITVNCQYYANKAWTKENKSNIYPRLTKQDANHNGQVSDAFLKNGDFFKIQNLQIGYTFPKEMIKPLKMDNLRLFASVENLFTFTGYEAGDPEIGTSQVLQTGFDGGRYPFPRTYTFGITVGF